ncbi:hypothetical protein [Deinococcus sp. QL22]|uniref:hypothetical protein n=1 Tax=Deinococcus sp. QL22 TaxID=2939437 RepID=UPI00201782B1|nr:hypothetical protein [Deinococcus sp. QL22]UQN05043.1 hypothetical protein M1R55_08980 [Deinococcus sp. QL22]
MPFAALPLFYLLLTLICAAGLGALLLRPGAARAGVVWAVAALLPVLAAVTAALTGQASANATLSRFSAQPLTVTLVNPADGGTDARPVTLNTNDAACLERTLRLMTSTTRASLQVPGLAPIPLSAATSLEGQLPPQFITEALEVRGDLSCGIIREEER